MEVYKRREYEDERMIHERRETMDRRHAINAFKAHEQQREEQLRTMKQVELHNIKMAEAEERKALYDAAFREKMDSLEDGKLTRLVRASDTADSAVENKRVKATEALELWRAGVERAERLSKRRELGKIEKAESKWTEYTSRLWKIGADRHHAPVSQKREDARLKAKIQKALVERLDDNRKIEGNARMQALEAKLEAAANRRRQGLLGSRYDLVEKAFGSSALGFDAKHHSVHVDRRSPQWRRNVVAWELQKDALSLSEPNLPTWSLLPGWARKGEQATSTK
jgi:hypothetical protein